MRSWVRRLRGVLSIGTLWSAAGLTFGAVAGLVASVIGGVPLSTAVLEWGVGSAAIGLILGTSFATALTVLEGRGTLAELTLKRAAACGALAGLAVPLAALGVLLVAGGPPLSFGTVLPVFLSATLSYGLLGAGLAAGTVAVAQRAPDELEAGVPEAARLGMSPEG